MAVKSRKHKSGVKMNFSGYDALRRKIKSGIESTVDDPDNEYSASFRRWARYYREFLRRRFREKAAGGGEWDKIAEETKKWRKKKHGITHELILWVTESLYAATGTYEKRTKYGITVGMGEDPHPDFNGTARRLAAIHAAGGNAPVRQIIEDADSETVRKMEASIKRAHAIEVNKANRKAK